MSETVKHILSVGIDVSKATLDVAFKSNDSYQCFQTGNNEAGIKKLIKQLQKLEFTGKIIIESTACYHYLVVLLLSKADFDVRLINPMLTKQYSRGRIRKLKTDKSDSQLLASMALVEEKLPPKYKATAQDMQIRLKIGLICSLEKQIQAAKATLQRFQQSCKTLDLETGQTENSIAQRVFIK